MDTASVRGAIDAGLQPRLAYMFALYALLIPSSLLNRSAEAPVLESR